MAYESVNWANKGEEEAKKINKTNLNHMDKGIETLDLNKIEISKLVAVSETAPTVFEEDDQYYNLTDKNIYTAIDNTTWSLRGEDPATNKLYIDLSESKLYYYDGIDFKSYGGGSGGGETLAIGTILPYSSSTLPSGYMLCDGSEISRTTYSKLFEIIGTSYGEGDGSTTFNIPNLKGRVPVGQDKTDTDFDKLGQAGGEKKHTLTIDELPDDSVKLNNLFPVSQMANTTEGYAGDGHFVVYLESGDYFTTQNLGKGQSHNNLQPYQVVNYIIKVSQTTPTQSQVVDGYSTSTTDTYSCNYVNNAIKEVYSTEEVKTNKIWKDGKPIYTKVISTIVSSIADELNSLNVDSVVDLKGNYDSNYDLNWEINSSVSEAGYRLSIYRVKSTKAFNVGYDDFISGTNSIEVTIEYTKTTD